MHLKSERVEIPLFSHAQDCFHYLRFLGYFNIICSVSIKRHQDFDRGCIELYVAATKTWGVDLTVLVSQDFKEYLARVHGPRKYLQMNDPIRPACYAARNNEGMGTYVLYMRIWYLQLCYPGC